ncbi:MAG: GNAT family N-acetyltransferase [Anaerovoracaceae bacterium]
MNIQNFNYPQLTEPAQLREASVLFEGWKETMIWSALQNIQGRVFADTLKNPSSAAVILGDFCFLAGKPDTGLIQFAAALEDYPLSMCIMVPQDPSWAKLVEKSLGQRARKVTRYATEKDGNAFDRGKLEAMAENVPEGYVLQMLDAAIYQQALSEEWSFSLCGQFASYRDFQSLGIGVAAVDRKDGKLAASAASYSRYEKGIEIEIDTHPDHRLKGLARCCGARLILECLDRGLYPSWDAQNPESLHLAESFGYKPAGTYTAYEIAVKSK